MKDYSRFIRKFKDTGILTIGDVMLDEYIWGKVNRISPEAPVQVVEVSKTTSIPGGAANVANNIAALSGRAWILGVAGEDAARDILRNELASRKIDPILITEDRPTIKKVRIIGQNQQLLRLDYENTHPITKKTHNKIIGYVKELLPQIDCVIISDYAKGIVTKELVESIKDIVMGEGKKVVIDPKPRNMKLYQGVSLVTPNNKEAARFADIDEESEDDLLKIGKKILKNLDVNVLITRGEKGMSLFEKNGKITHIPTKARQVYDVTGAGDTVIAVTAMALAAGADYADAAAIANYAAGIVVGKVGTATTTIEELKEAMKEK
jgi:D-beta-D-heptose 7-phosphate kinase/D-beta-D-heptose 1-phosphate adenosyltransferase